MEFLLAGTASVAAGVISNPLDVAKTRLQMQGELKAKGQYAIEYKNVFQAVWHVASGEGIRAVQKGLAPALCYQFIMNGTRLGAYHWMEARGYLHGTGDKSGEIVGWKSIIAAGFTGCLGTSLGSPFYLVKTNLQADPTHHKNPGTVHLLREVWRVGGIKGLWKGVNGAIGRMTVGSATQLTTFSATMEYLDKHPVAWINGPFAAPILCSVASGFSNSVTMTPFDVVATRLYQQPVGADGKGKLYSGWFNCVYRIIRTEGPGGFYKGWSASLGRIGAHSIFNLLFWHMLRTLFYTSPTQSLRPPPVNIMLFPPLY